MRRSKTPANTSCEPKNNTETDDGPVIPAGGRQLRLKEVLARVPFGRSSLYEMMDAGQFPRGYRIKGKKLRVWLESEVDAATRALLIPIGDAKDNPPAEPVARTKQNATAPLRATKPQP